MTLPISPTDLQEYTDTTTKRKFVYSSATNSWSRVRKIDLKDLSDVSNTTPALNENLIWDNTSSQWIPSANAGLAPYVPMLYRSVAPTSSDVAEPGTMWSLTDTDLNNTNTAYIATYTDLAGTKTSWKEIGEVGDHYIHPVVTVSATAPATTEEGSVWYDTTASRLRVLEGGNWEYTV